MSKSWISKDSKKNKVILIENNSIYKGNPKLDRFSSNDIDNEKIKESLFNIPYNYIKRIENQSQKSYIKIYFGNDSEEELFTDNDKIKNEIFNYLKDDISSLRYFKELPSVFKYAKPQFFALLFTTILFAWAMYLAIQIENGAEYEIVGGGRSITSIVLGIANFGVFKVLIGYIVLLFIIIAAITRRLSSRSEIEVLQR